MASSPVPVQVVQTGVLAGKTVVAIAAGEDHSLALCSDGTVAAWGSESYGGNRRRPIHRSHVPVAVNSSGVLAGKSVVRIAAGRRHSLVVCSDGTAVGWGFNIPANSEMAATLHSNLVPMPVDQSGVLAGKQIVALAGGEFFSLALCSDGTLASWGNNNSGQLGNGVSYVSSNVPVLVNQSGVLAGRTVVEIAPDTAMRWRAARTVSSPDGEPISTGTLATARPASGAASYGGWHGHTRRSHAPDLGPDLFSITLTHDGTLAAWGMEWIGPTRG
jgi:alpha-tubulin suppressor-like RCC1 family protein